MRPLVSFIVPCYNGARYLEDAIKSVLAQTYTNLECIIVDDGSTDCTRQVSESLMRRDARVKYFYKEHGGAYIARNFGIERAQGEWIHLLDADDWIHEDKLNFQLSYLDGHGSEDVIFYSDYQLVYQDDDENVVKRVTNIVGDLSNEQLLERALTWDFSPDFPFIVHSLLIKRSLFERRMFDEALKHFGDIEFEIDALLRGTTFVYTPLVGAFYRQHPQQMTKLPHHKNYYVLLLELVHAKDSNLLQRNPNIARLISRAFTERDRERFNRLIRLIDTQQVPIYFSEGRIKLTNKALIRLAFWTRLLIPLSVPRALWGLYRGLQKTLRRTRS